MLTSPQARAAIPAQPCEMLITSVESGPGCDEKHATHSKFTLNLLERNCITHVCSSLLKTDWFSPSFHVFGPNQQLFLLPSQETRLEFHQREKGFCAHPHTHQTHLQNQGPKSFFCSSLKHTLPCIKPQIHMWHTHTNTCMQIKPHTHISNTHRHIYVGTTHQATFQKPETN